MPILNSYDVLGNKSLQQPGVGINVVLRMIVAYIIYTNLAVRYGTVRHGTEPYGTVRNRTFLLYRTVRESHKA